MDSILVELYLPAADISYDVYIPLQSKLHEVILLLVSTFSSLSGAYFASYEDTVLCDKASGNVLDINFSAEELGLQNGSKLMLI